MVIISVTAKEISAAIKIIIVMLFSTLLAMKLFELTLDAIA